MKSIGLTIIVAMVTLTEWPVSVGFNLGGFNLVPRPVTHATTKPKTRRPIIKTLHIKNSLIPKLPLNHPCKKDARSHNFELNSFETKAAFGRQVLCRRLNTTELTSMLTCSGAFKRKFSATSFQFAQRNSEELLPKIRRQGRFRNSEGGKSTKSRIKRDIGQEKMPHNTTAICNCVKRLSVDAQTGLGLPCGLCSTTYRQADSSRFPQYINGIVCHPNETNPVHDAFGNPMGSCVQSSFEQHFLERTGEWEIDPVMTAQLGGNKIAYKEKWRFYTQTIKAGCRFMFYVV